MVIANFLRSFLTPTQKAEQHTFIVVSAYCPDGVTTEEGFALREIIQSYHPTDWAFFNPGSFVVLYASAMPDAKSRAEALATSLRAFGNLPRLGVGVEEGNLIAAFSADGRLSSWPIGTVINTANLKAQSAATGDISC
ncbi:MAG: hypothetical protein K8Q92_03195 [Methylophilales bacterium]|nr:hypothetical protein [Methylophilales bacterium]